MASVAPLIAQLARQYGLDPQAVLAVARGEGGLQNREGDIGDLSGGGSFGPFQLYTKGALPAQYRGRPQAADQWAWSPEGIKYALGRMQAVGAGGLRGGDAVRRIITRFERPKDPRTSIANALGRLGGGGGSAPLRGAMPSGRIAAPPASMPNNSKRDFILQGLIAGRDPNDLIAALPGMRESGPLVNPVKPSPAGNPPRPLPASGVTPRGNNIRELIYDPVGSVFDGVRSNKPYGGHSDHLHYAGSNPQQMLRAIALARQLGLSVRENPYTDRVDPVHTKNSFHYRTFPGLFAGKRLGEAADISGNPQKLRSLYAKLAGL